MPAVEPAQRLVRFTPPAGLESWRFVRDLEVGDVAIVLCDGSTFTRVANGALETETVMEWLKTRTDRIETPGIGRFLLLFGSRARFLDADGVIDKQALHPGQLTRSLCSPWQYDFADCGCFYWASNKPDLVSSDAQPAQVLNFQRSDRSAGSDRSTTDDDWILKQAGRWDGDGAIVRHAEMLTKWAALPFVVRRRETDRYVPVAAAASKVLLDRAGIIDRLSRLAPVEHALAIEYLYAYYSLGVPMVRSDLPLSPQQACIHTAGQEIFQVAVDEMRHLRSVNEILIELQEPWQLDRADVIGEDFDKNGKAFAQPFALRPLDGAQLDWFINVERASQNQDDQNTIDGMYTLILLSVQQSADFSPGEKTRISALLKVIIDEGIDHFARFSRAKAALAGIDPQVYLQVKDSPLLLPDGQPDRLLQDVADAAYLVVLRSLDYAFQVGDAQRGAMLESARRAMYNMDDAARSLAQRSIGAMFDYHRFGKVKAPSPVKVGLAGPHVAGNADPAGTRAEAARSLGDPLRDVLDQLAGSGGAHAELAGRMHQRLERMTQDFVNHAAAGN